MALVTISVGLATLNSGSPRRPSHPVAGQLLVAENVPTTAEATSTTTSTLPATVTSHAVGPSTTTTTLRSASEVRLRAALNARRRRLVLDRRQAHLRALARARHEAALHRAALHRAAAHRAALRRAAAHRRWLRTHRHHKVVVVRHGQHLTGVATWYAWHPGQCATSYRPKGTRIWVENLANHKTISCLVTDYEPRNTPGRIVDLDTQQFAELAPLAQGVIRVRVTW
jgi:hypothetical protein